MRLPGGLLHEGNLRRDFAFRPLTGAVELALSEVADSEGTIPARVTAALAATLEHVGGEGPKTAVVSDLCVADRQYLMRQLAARLGMGETWLTAHCGGCGERFDFAVTHTRLPVKEGGPGFPFAMVDTSLGPCRFRVPTGADQEVVAGLEDETPAFRALVARCLVASPGLDGDQGDAEAVVRAFTTEDCTQIETALEMVAPEVATAVQATCPACGILQAVDLDPYLALTARPPVGLLSEIHLLASTYHWSEGEILALPLGRRRRYLELIDRSRGMAG